MVVAMSKEFMVKFEGSWLPVLAITVMDMPKAPGMMVPDKSVKQFERKTFLLVPKPGPRSASEEIIDSVSDRRAYTYPGGINWIDKDQVEAVTLA